MKCDYCGTELMVAQVIKDTREQICFACLLKYYPDVAKRMLEKYQDSFNLVKTHEN